MPGGSETGVERVNGRNLFSRLKKMNRDDLEIYGLTLVIYVLLFIFASYTWFGNVPYRLDAIDKVLWAVVFLLTTDFIYCYWNYGLILDLRRDFNFWASMIIIGLIIIFFILLIFFW